LNSQKCVFNRAKIGYNPVFLLKKSIKITLCIENLPTVLISSLVFTVLKKGHTFRNYQIKKFDVPSSKVKWQPKCVRKEFNAARPKLNKGPNSFI